MDNLHHKSAAYWQPAFLICAGVLVLAAAGMSVATRRLGLYLEKEPLPLRKPLGALDEEKLAPYRVLTRGRIENEEILKSLGTEDYLQWVLEDPRESSESAVRKLLLFITYYQRPDRVPHVPEECYTGGGYQRLATDAILFGCDRRRDVPGRYLLFDKTAREVSQRAQQFPVLYLFRVNGRYAGSRDDARIALNQNVFGRHSYFCKIEMVFNQSLAAPAKDDAVAACTKLLAVLLPLLEREHWPDLE
ncbi:MAG: hypothetical protein A2Y77_13670 [Planctomycetes bacterium RBG_13_62_9]|nr:MAG: hypothetical protein A2Y77_13670 [Planctomycetes bacterium RBG_13_62_9]